METLTIPASEITEGDFIPGLDHGYVIKQALNAARDRRKAR